MGALQVELGQLVLKRFLLLAALLDRAVSGPNPCPKGAPLLFRRGQPTKSSAQVTALFLRNYSCNSGNYHLWQGNLGRMAKESNIDCTAESALFHVSK